VSSLIDESSGLRRIEVIVRGKRQRIRLGRMDRKSAESLKVRIDDLAEAVALGGRNADVEKWCDRLSEDLRAKLVAAGLLQPRGW
jgi:hypothetical protein